MLRLGEALPSGQRPWPASQHRAARRHALAGMSCLTIVGQSPVATGSIPLRNSTTPSQALPILFGDDIGRLQKRFPSALWMALATAALTSTQHHLADTFAPCGCSRSRSFF